MSLAQLRAFQQRFPEERATIDGAIWSCRRSRGTGAALLMLPGAQGTGDMFYRFALAHGERLDVITLTYPGSSDSERVAAGLAQAMDWLALPRANVLGSSLGGYLAQLFALQHPQRIETLFIANSFCDASAFQALMPSAAEFAKLPAEGVMNGLLDKMAAAPEPDPAHRDLKDVVRALVGPAQSAEVLKSRLLAVLLAKPVPPLPFPRDRIVVIDDEADPVIPPAMRACVRERYAGAEQHAIAGGGHYPGILRADEYAAILARRLVP